MAAHRTASVATSGLLVMCLLLPNLSTHIHSLFIPRSAPRKGLQQSFYLAFPPSFSLMYLWFALSLGSSWSSSSFLCCLSLSLPISLSLLLLMAALKERAVQASWAQENRTTHLVNKYFLLKILINCPLSYQGVDFVCVSICTAYTCVCRWQQEGNYGLLKML